jgi:uncharacterized protein with PQ loop repeat
MTCELCHSCTSCTDACVQWIDRYFAECKISVAQQSGFFLGLFSTLVWVWAQVPQVILNFRNGSVTGLSAGFVLLICAGDVGNLLGVIVAQGLVTQIITASWFLLIDCLCALQIAYYHFIKPRCGRPPEPSPIPPAIPLLIAGAAAANPRPYEIPYLWGTLLGWGSAACYLSSRLPQLYENYRRQTTEGLSPHYFLSAFVGNMAYGLSIFLHDSSWQYIWRQFPWLVGSLGNIVLDFGMIYQFIRYRKKKEMIVQEAEQSGTDAGHTDMYLIGTDRGI